MRWEKRVASGVRLRWWSVICQTIIRGTWHGTQLLLILKSSNQNSELEADVRVENQHGRLEVCAMMDKEGFSGKYDFLYLPIDAWLRADSVFALKVLVCFSSKDFRSKASLGYAFVNLISAREAAMAVVFQIWYTYHLCHLWFWPQARQFWKAFDGYTKWVLPSAKAGAWRVTLIRLANEDLWGRPLPKRPLSMILRVGVFFTTPR